MLPLLEYPAVQLAIIVSVMCVGWFCLAIRKAWRDEKAEEFDSDKTSKRGAAAEFDEGPRP